MPDAPLVMVDIIALNQLSQNEQKIFVPTGTQAEPFDYSDGAEVEQYLYEVLQNATDRSTRSEELQAAVVDWPSEYHLSSDRANLLRPFNLEAVERVLELGSGCGAISRYLGEQGKQVDAVEGSTVRAALGKLRCRELENVRVINANYNELSVPEDYYDLILFVGVIEYARKFQQQSENDRSAAQAILSQSRKFLSSKGAILVAIENRLGLKYLLGAHEDHYAKRYIGVNGYRESAGIATYSQNEWRSLVKDVGFTNVAFSYPFPDYKIPRVVLAEDYVRNNPHAANHLEGIVSRDYYAPIPRTPTEMICWQGASSGNFLADVSNSFCVLMSDDAEAIGRLQNFDFCHGPGHSRKNCYAVTTVKPANQDRVIKVPVASTSGDKDPDIQQQLEAQPFIRGDLLAAQWLRTILIYVRRNEFDRVVRDYYAYLERKESNKSLQIDMLPINIMIDSGGEWQTFDQEWRVEWSLTKEYLLFRALLTFIVTNWTYLKDFLGWLELQTVRDFIEYGFQINNMQLNEHLEFCIAHEDRFQKAIARDQTSEGVNQLLATVFDFSDEKELMYPSVYWRGPNEKFSEQRKTTLQVTAEPKIRTLRFIIGPVTGLESIRFDPFDIRREPDVGFFRIGKIGLSKRMSDEENVLWQLNGTKEIAEHCEATSAVLSTQEGLSAWIAVTDFPKLEFVLPTPLVIDASAEYVVEIDLALVNTMEYVLAYNRFLVSERQLKLDIQSTKLAFDSKVGEVAVLQRKLADTTTELESIKASKPFLIGSKLVELVGGIKKLGGRG
ncbi:MAG: class I SAM-dependent methyltransferase [Gammaproteobacteria bacterium]